MAAVPTVNAFRKNAFSHLSARRPRLLCLPTPYGVVRTHRLTRNCTARMVSLFHQVVAKRTLRNSSNQASMDHHLRATNNSSSPCTISPRSKAGKLSHCRHRILPMLVASAQTTSRTPPHCRRQIRLLKCLIGALVMGSTPTLINLLVRPLSLLPRIPPRIPPHTTFLTKARGPLHLLIPAICSLDLLSEMMAALLLQRSRRSAPPLTAPCCNLLVVDQSNHGS